MADVTLLDAKGRPINRGQGTKATSLPVTLASDEDALLVTPPHLNYTTDSVNVGNFPATQPISAAALPLPAGASTETTLAALNTKTPALGQALAAASSPVVLTAAQITTLTPPAALTNFALETGGNLATLAGAILTGAMKVVLQAGTAIIGKVGIDQTAPGTTNGVVINSSALPTGASTETTLAALNTKTPALGQALAAASSPVVLTAAQITTLTPLTSVGVNNFPATQPVSAVSLPLPTGASTETTLAALNTASGATSDAIVAAGATGSFNAKLRRVTQGLEDLKTLLVLAAGSNVIGKVGIDQTTPGTTNLVQSTHGKTLKSITGSASATFAAVAAVTSKRIKVYSLSLLTSSTTAVTVTFKDGAAGTALATYPLQAISGTNFGLAETSAVPGSLFATTAGNLLEMSFSGAQSVTYNLRYFDDDAT